MVRNREQQVRERGGESDGEEARERREKERDENGEGFFSRLGKVV